MMWKSQRAPRLDRLMLWMGFAISATVLAGFVASAYLFASHHAGRLLEESRRSTLAQAEVLRSVLEHQMREKDRSLIANLVRSVARDPNIHQVFVLNRHGEVRYSSRPELPPPDLASPTCQACHRSPPEERVQSRVIDLGEDQEVLRTVTPIRNRPECFSCHGAENRINGVLIMDVDARRIPAEVRRDAETLALWGGGVVVAVLALLGLLLRAILVRRLHELQKFGGRLAAGEVDLRMPVQGHDVLSFIAESFNSLADSMTRLVREVQDERAHLERIINSIPDGIVVLDQGLRIVAANDAFLQRTGLSRQALMGRTCRSLAGLACREGRCPAAEVLSGTAREDTVVLEVPQAMGEVRHEEVRASAVLQGGRTIHVIEVWRDITRRRLEEARLAESYRLASLGMLASGFSHELNTPLQTVLACLEGMRSSLEGGTTEDREFLLESVQIAREQVLRCRAISGQFLRLAQGGLSEGEVSDLGALIEAAVRLARPMAREAGVTLAMEAPSGPVLVRAAEGPVQLVLLNLLVNAVEASPRGKTVRVALRWSPDGPLCEVADEGAGISPENVPRIFEPFFTTKPRGTGLGLFLAREFARGWGGDIRVERADGPGTRFVVSFRSADASPEGG